jgi:hypothetical protein
LEITGELIEKDWNLACRFGDQTFKGIFEGQFLLY